MPVEYDSRRCIQREFLYRAIKVGVQARRTFRVWKPRAFSAVKCRLRLSRVPSFFFFFLFFPFVYRKYRDDDLEGSGLKAGSPRREESLLSWNWSHVLSRDPRYALRYATNGPADETNLSQRQTTSDDELRSGIRCLDLSGKLGKFSRDHHERPMIPMTRRSKTTIRQRASFHRSRKDKRVPDSLSLSLSRQSRRRRAVSAGPILMT